jgi:probable FeS assembly SUF system protein SufT
MQNHEPRILIRDVEASIVPVGTKVTLQKGEEAIITQSLGGTYTVVVNGNMFRIDAKNADALGFEIAPAETAQGAVVPSSPEDVEKEVWNQMRTVYDPEIPVNIVDLGLVYDCKVEPMQETDGLYRVDVKMTLTAPGCGMGPVLQEDVHNKVLSIENVEEANVELVWDPPWNQGMMTEAAQLQLGLM